MPELPEVETIRKGLGDKLIGHKITDFVTYWPKMLGGLDEKEFADKIKNKRIESVERRAKIIAVKLSGDINLLFHMKMTGHLIYTSKNHKIDSIGKWLKPEGVEFSDPHNQYIRAIFYLDKGKILAFSDLRKFGYVKLLSGKELQVAFSEYGPEPFSKNFNTTYLSETFGKKNIAIKKVIMDQSLIAGIGNIYADEILWDAEIHPEKKACELDEQEIENFRESTIKILKKSIKLRGTSTSDFRDTNGKKGEFGRELKAYQKTGKKCSKDSGTIEKIMVGGRGTHYCPVHQILEEE